MDGKEHYYFIFIFSYTILAHSKLIANFATADGTPRSRKLNGAEGIRGCTLGK